MRTGAPAHWRTGALGALAHRRTGAPAHWRTGAQAHWRTGALAHRLTGAPAHLQRVPSLLLVDRQIPGTEQHEAHELDILVLAQIIGDRAQRDARGIAHRVAVGTGADRRKATLRRPCSDATSRLRR
jgi:hypothetical protein